MKKLVFALLLLFSINGYSQIGFGMGVRVPLNGNSGRPRAQMIEDHVQQMRKDLKLDDDQVIKVRSLLVERDRRRKASDPMLAKEFNERLRQALTPEQNNKLTELRREKRQRMQENKPNTAQPEEKEWDDVYSR